LAGNECLINYFEQLIAVGFVGVAQVVDGFFRGINLALTDLDLQCFTSFNLFGE